VSRAHHCLHAWHLECTADHALKTPPPSGMQEIIDAGLAHERRCAEQLGLPPQPEAELEDWDEGAAHTLALMQAGEAWIYQAVLVTEGGRGIVDFLERIERSSSLGEWSYRPVDSKGHKKVEPRNLIEEISTLADCSCSTTLHSSTRSSAIGRRLE